MTVPKIHFPEWMTDRRRWLVRPNRDGVNKQPFSPLETRPAAYETPPGKEDKNSYSWRWRWNVPAIWADYAAALSYQQRRPDKCEGLSFVCHPGEDYTEAVRPVCFDFDGAFGPDGNPLPAVQDFIDVADTFVEYSRSGRGLHVFVLVKCEPFKNVLQADAGGCMVDVLCSSQIAVTGRVFDGNRDIRELPIDFVRSLPFMEFRGAKPTEGRFDFGEWWAMEPGEIGPEHAELVRELEEWPEGVQHEGRERIVFAAACHIMRYGVTGWIADALLQLAPTQPPYSDAERRHRLECAYRETTADGTFGTFGQPAGEFGELPVEDRKPNPLDFGFNVVSAYDLEEMDLKLEFVVEDAFVDGQATFIGGREKTFKTGIAADLLISLATGADFLGRFRVLDRRSSAFFTAEIGLAPAADLIRRIREEKGLAKGSINGLDIIDTVPSFQLNPKTGQAMAKDEFAGLLRYLDHAKPDIACFDPLYFAMGGAAVGDMYEIGAVLKNISRICTERGIWPIFCHHARKDSTKEFQPMDLADFYGSGVSAFARQWLLLSHSAPFTDGVASLYGRMGGSATGDLGLWDIQVAEGKTDGIITSRRWAITVQESGGGSPRTDDEVYEWIGEGTDIRDITTTTGLPKKDVQASIKRLVKAGKVTLTNGKFNRA